MVLVVWQTGVGQNVLEDCWVVLMKRLRFRWLVGYYRADDVLNYRDYEQIVSDDAEKEALL